MGTRQARSTERSARLVVDEVREALASGGTALLLQLDLQGAFETVDHNWLIYTFHTLRLPE